MTTILLCCLFVVELTVAGAKIDCRESDLKFEKVIGLRPSNSNFSRPLPLFKPEKGSDWRPITEECLARCKSNEECASFLLDYRISECYWFKDEINGDDESNSVLDEDAAWFVKVCLRNGSECDKLWSFERIPGATLIGSDTKTLPMPMSRAGCQQHCLNESAFDCRSAKYKITSANFAKADVQGVCTLSDTDRHLSPNSYRVSSYDDEYLENQCGKTLSQANQEFCAYEEYDNVTLAHCDFTAGEKTKDECQALCENFKRFKCRGFSVVDGTCLLHSEDSKIHGPNSLKDNIKSTYYEKAPCLNITVSCSETYLMVKYLPEIDFQGKIYMQGYSENPGCYATGEGKYRVISLKLPLLSNSCGIIRAMGTGNRTLLSGSMIIQYNSIIQTQGDRLIKVGCIFGNDSKVLIGTGVKITSSLPTKGSTLINSLNNKTISPTVEMRILDLKSQKEVSDTQIGQELELVIEIKSQNTSYDIWASHLVAMTEKTEESIFLLDDRGCPTNLNIFPALEKYSTNTSTRLSATFQAFKFASSPVVRFSVIVQFCANNCPPIECGNNVMSFIRKKREIVSRTIQTINGTTVVNVNRSEFEDRASVVDEMPLEYIMLVRDAKSFPDRLIFGENNKILVAGYDLSTNEVCLDYSLVIGLIIVWVIVQILFLAGCVVLVRRYKRYYQHECNRQSLEELHKNFGIGFSNLENRRVHWADKDNIM